MSPFNKFQCPTSFGFGTTIFFLFFFFRIYFLLKLHLILRSEYVKGPKVIFNQKFFSCAIVLLVVLHQKNYILKNWAEKITGTQQEYSPLNF